MAKGNFTTDELTNYYAKIYAEVEDSTVNDPYGNYILQRVKGGQKSVFNKTQSEIRNFDMSFLDTIESVYPAILKIMRDPKKSIRYESEVVQVEKAKKTNSETVRHLASHTQFIKSITEDNVIPSKVLTTFAEDELAIYENRFIKSLVKRLDQFVERRYEVMKVSLESFETEKLDVKNTFMVSGQEVTIDLDIEIKNDLTADVETTKEQFNRLLQVRQDIAGLKGTEFMRALAKAKDVLPPIMKTNIILHNPDFKLCYGLWLYLDRVDSIATNVDVKEKAYKYSKIFDKDINACMALALTSFIKNRGIDGIYASKKLQQIKAPKPEENKDLEIELNFEADTKKLEDYTMNEALLSETAKFFEASLDGLQRSGNKFNESIRVVYRQMLDMLDQIYPTAFGVADEELESRDLYEQLEFARRRMMIFKIVRQAKQMNIARMGKEEKRIEKLISKLEDKIKVKEQKDRERQERERQREEAKRLAQIERDRKENARKRKLEKDALDAQKAIERQRREAEMKENEISPEIKARNEIMAPLAEAKRNHLKELREEAKKREAEAVAMAEKEVQAPVRRKDEYDDLTDEELAELMAANDLLGEQLAAEDAKANPQPKKKVVKKKKPEEPKEEAKAQPKVDENKSIEDMTADELEALMSQNGLGFDSLGDEPEKPKAKAKTVKKAEPKPKKQDANADLQGLDDKDEEPKVKKPSISLKPKKKKEEPTEESKAPVEENNEPVEEKPVESNEEPTDNTPAEEAPEVTSEPEATEATEPEASEESNDETSDDTSNNDNNVESSDDTEPSDNTEDTSDAPSDDLDSLSDEELDKLMADNGMPTDEPITEPKEEQKKEAPKAPKKPKISLKPKAKPKDEDSAPAARPSSSDDDLDSLSDEELEALFKENVIEE